MAGEGNMDSGVNNSINAGGEASETPNVDQALASEATSKENAESILGTSPPMGEQKVQKDGSILGKNDNDENQSEDQEEEEVVPIEYEDFKLPENLSIDNEMMSTAKEKFAALKIPQDKAQELVDMNTEAVNKALQAKDQEWLNTTQKWATEVANDPELGGANYGKTISKANRALAKFDQTGGLTDFFTTSNAGNNPDMIRFLVAVDNATSDAGFIKGGSSAGPQKEESLGDIFYGNQDNK